MSNTKIENILKYTAIATGGVGLTSFAVLKTHRLIREAIFSRNEPKEVFVVRNRMHKKAVKSSIVEQERLASGEELQKKDLQTVECTARDGAVLIGHYLKHPSPKRVIIAFHGWRSPWYRDFSPIWEYWQEECSVIFVEQRAHGESGGEYLGYGTLERYDVLSWAEQVKELIGWEDLKESGKPLPIYLAGTSMGAATVLLAAGLELPEGISGILADCGFTSMEAIWEEVMKTTLRVPKPIREAELRYLKHCIRKTGGELCSTLDAMDKCRTPVFFAHGMEDDFVPPFMTEQNYARCKALIKRLYLGPNAGHGACFYHNREAYRRGEEAFFRDCEG